jgi:hypothetical protein
VIALPNEFSYVGFLVVNNKKLAAATLASTFLVLMVNVPMDGQFAGSYLLFNDPRHGRKSLLRTRGKLVNPRDIINIRWKILDHASTLNRQ